MNRGCAHNARPIMLGFRYESPLWMKSPSLTVHCTSPGYQGQEVEFVDAGTHAAAIHLMQALLIWAAYSVAVGQGFSLAP